MTAPVQDAAQRTAADPTISAFVTANAGSGKTKTLNDRVARLLLAGVDPQKVVDAGFSPQLTLTAAILAHGTFEDVGRLKPGELTYLEITGRKPAGREEVRATAGEESHEAAERALAGLRTLIARYWAPDQPFVSRTAPQFVHQYASDYDHLARVFEWSTSGEEGEE